MSPVSADILKPGSIHGIYPKSLGNTQAEQIGLAFGTLVKDEYRRNIKVVVGHDNRHSSGALNRWLIQGLRNTGLKIVDAGFVSSPLLAYAVRFSGASVGIMITGSHTPAQYNGFKVFTQEGPALLDWMDRLYRILKSQNFRKGAGVVEKKTFYADYRNALVNTVAQNFKGLKITVDVGNGTAALTVPMALEALHCEVDVLNGESNGDFPGRGADSSQIKVLNVLGERVRKTKSQLGVAFDADGDRISFVDEKGHEVPNDVVLCLFSTDLLKRQKNGSVVFDGGCSDLVEKTVRDLGGAPLLEKTGHSFIFDRMKKSKSLLGGEASGHFFLPGSFPGDVLYACLRLLELLKGSQKSLSEVCAAFPVRVSTHDVNLAISPEKVPSFYESLKNRALEKGAKVSTLDGVRAVFDDGWGIVHNSGIEPFLSCRFEAPTLGKLTQLIKLWLCDHPEVQEKIFRDIE